MPYKHLKFLLVIRWRKVGYRMCSISALVIFFADWHSPSSLVLLILRDLLPFILGADARPAPSHSSTLLQFSTCFHRLDLITSWNILARMYYRLGLCFGIVPSQRSILSFLRQLLLRPLKSVYLSDKPVDGPPKTARDERQDQEVYAVCRDKKNEQQKLETGKGDVCCDKERRCRTWRENRLEEIVEKGGHRGDDDSLPL